MVECNLDEKLIGVRELSNGDLKIHLSANGKACMSRLKMGLLDNLYQLYYEPVPSERLEDSSLDLLSLEDPIIGKNIMITRDDKYIVNRNELWTAKRKDFIKEVLCSGSFIFEKL